MTTNPPDPSPKDLRERARAIRLARSAEADVLDIQADSIEYAQDKAAQWQVTMHDIRILHNAGDSGDLRVTLANEFPEGTVIALTPGSTMRVIKPE